MNSNPPARVAIVTGAAQGIGRAIALRFASDGLAVAVNDVAGKKAQLDELVVLIKEKNVRALAVPANVSSENEVRGMVDEVVAQLGRVDVMVANAGVTIDSNYDLTGSAIMEADVEKWERLWSVNVRGVLLCYKYGAIQMVKQGDGGRLIGASSILGKRGFALCGAYCSSKFAVRALTQTAAQELDKHRITVNAYAPGCIETAMTVWPMDDQFGGPTATLKKFLNLPEAKTESPDVVASLVSFLASPESQFITGQTITVDGGVIFD